MDHIRHKHPADLQDLKGSTSCSDASSPVTPVRPVTQLTEQQLLSQSAVFVKHFIAFVL